MDVDGRENSMAPVTVQTGAGAVRGRPDNGVAIFRGVPYAAPPTGPLRFAAPGPVKPWAGVRDAFTNPEPAPQGGPPGAVIGSEDCLYLNLYVPVTSGPHPVLVWIHGGGAVGGGISDHDGRAFARAGVIVVTAAYRLGLLGFLHLPEVFGAANLAVQDLTAALHWISRNIAAFGGDPDRVTIAGQSNGGRLAVTLMATPTARGLFSQVIVQSGTAAGYAAYQPAQARQQADEVLAELSIPRENASVLREVPLEDLLGAQRRVVRAARTTVPFLPVVDGQVLPALPLDAMTASTTAGLRVLIGNNYGEEDLDRIPPILLTEADVRGVLSRARSLRPDLTPDELERYIGTWANHRLPSIRIAEKLSAAGAVAWMYRLDWRLAPRGSGPGAPHSLEIPLVFADPRNPRLPRTGLLAQVSPERVEAISHTMHRAWVRFLQHGDPNGRPGPGRELPEWAPYTARHRATMVFDDACSIEVDPGREIRLLWPPGLALVV
jgi:para-nitrobenzyl esterase